VRFVDFLRTSVLLCAASATALGTVTVLAASADADRTLVFVVAVWWVIAGVIGTRIGRHSETNSPIARLLATARTTTSLPEQRPGSTLVNRLWPLLLSTILALGLGLVAPQVPGIACGFAIAGALAWRRQESAVTAIEERDGIAYYVEPTSPVKPMRLVRAPGFRRDLAGADGHA
jgi:hypothetical protein